MQDNNSTSGISQIHRDRWWIAEDLAQLLGVSTRTLYRKLKRGEVAKCQTDEGMRYRLVNTTDTQLTDVSVSSVSDMPVVTVIEPALFELKATDTGVSKAFVSATDTQLTNVSVSSVSDMPVMAAIKPATFELKSTDMAVSKAQAGPLASNELLIHTIERLARSEFERGLIQTDRDRLQEELNDTLGELDRLLSYVGDITGEMIELERRLALASQNRDI